MEKVKKENKMEIKLDAFKGLGMVLILLGIFFLPLELKFKLLFGIGWALWNSKLVLKWKK